MWERRFPRELGALEAIFGFVREFLEAEGLDGNHAFELDLVVEELFTNMVKYNGGDQDIALGLGRDAGRIRIVLRDFGVPPFDPTRAPEVDTSRPLEERTPGGLGIHLVRSIADEIRYEHRDGNSTITVTKRLEL